MSWRYIGRSVQGTSHQEKSVPCQDTCVCRCQNIYGSEVFWAIVADGAGSAQYGGIGSDIACNTLANIIERWLDKENGNLTNITFDNVKSWIEKTRSAIAAVAERKPTPIREYACTLLGIIAGNDRTICFQVGDGAIVLMTDSHCYGTVFWPDNGEYANTTYFITDSDAIANLQIEIFSYKPQNIALFTDGMQRLSLQFATCSVYIPFFTPMFQSLALEPPGLSEKLNHQLELFLNSPSVNQRTDDDKTLVLATFHS